MVSPIDEIHEIAAYIATIQGVVDVEHPVDEAVLTDAVQTDPAVDADRVIRVVTTDTSRFHERMRARFDREAAASIHSLNDDSHEGKTHLTVYVEATRTERGYEPVVEYQSLDADDYAHLDEALLAEGMDPISQELYEDLEEFQYIVPVQPDELPSDDDAGKAANSGES